MVKYSSLFQKQNCSYHHKKIKKILKNLVLLSFCVLLLDFVSLKTLFFDLFFLKVLMNSIKLKMKKKINKSVNVLIIIEISQ